MARNVSSSVLKGLLLLQAANGRAESHQMRHLLDEDDNCLLHFNPGTKEDYESVIASWVGTLLVLAEHISLHPQPQQVSEEASQEQLPEPKARPYIQDLAT